MPKRRDKSEPPGSSAAGTVMLLIAVVYAAFPQLRNWYLVAAATGVGLVLTFIGSGRVYRPAVTQVSDAIICRYNPWREGTFYLAAIGLPLFGSMTIAWGSMADRGSPTFWRALGVLMIVSASIPIFVLFRQSRSTLLRISPGALSVSTPEHQRTVEIPRAAVQAVTATTGRLGNGAAAPVTQINYQSKDSAGGGTRTVLFGPTNTKKIAWLTVEQSDLLAGLQAWKDGDPNDSGLMDRVEQLLCGSRPATSDSGTH